MPEQHEVDRWIVRYGRRRDARLGLICFHYAGGGASVFHAWGKDLPEEIEVLAIQMPGRESRFREPPFRRMNRLVEDLGRAVEPICRGPFACVGHSMGALVAFEVVRWLRRTTGAMPERLFVSGRCAPQAAVPATRIHELPDAELARELQARYRGLPDVFVNNPEMQAAFFPTLRADLELIDTYRYADEPPLDCPISAFGGLEDGVSEEDLKAWAGQTAAAFRLHMLPGDHFFVNSQRDALVRIIARELLATSAPGGLDPGGDR